MSDLSKHQQEPTQEQEPIQDMDIQAVTEFITAIRRHTYNQALIAISTISFVVIAVIIAVIIAAIIVGLTTIMAAIISGLSTSFMLRD